MVVVQSSRKTLCCVNFKLNCDVINHLIPVNVALNRPLGQYASTFNDCFSPTFYCVKKNEKKCLQGMKTNVK